MIALDVFLVDGLYRVLPSFFSVSTKETVLLPRCFRFVAMVILCNGISWVFFLLTDWEPEKKNNFPDIFVCVSFWTGFFIIFAVFPHFQYHALGLKRFLFIYLFFLHFFGKLFCAILVSIFVRQRKRVEMITMQSYPVLPSFFFFF